MSGSLFPWGQAVGGEGWEGTEQVPVSPNSVSERCVSKKLSWDQKCSLTVVPPALHGVKPVTAALVLQGKPLSGGHSLCPIPGPTEPPKPQFFAFTFLLGLNTATGNKFTAQGPSSTCWVLSFPICYPCFSLLLLPVKCVLSVPNCARCSILFPK